jgi:threonine synthase
LALKFRCIECEKKYSIDKIRYRCDCMGLLEVHHKSQSDLREIFRERKTSLIPMDQSGVWRFREAILDVAEDEIISHPEGCTHLYERSPLSQLAKIESLFFKHEGENPTGSFKDRGMTVAVTQGRRLGAKTMACASTGNTSASLAAYAAQAGLKSVIFIPKGKVAQGKLAQALAYGARCLSIPGDFDQAMTLVSLASEKLGLYLVNSINPFRLEGQKTVIWEILEAMDWQAPDWIVVPGGNLGNTSAFGKAIVEAHAWGWINSMPRLATIQAKGANPFFKSFQEHFSTQHKVQAETVASAIQIGNPVNYSKAYRMINHLNGIVEQVSDEEILACKFAIDCAGIGCEPASAASLAGARKLRAQGIIRESDKVVCILTGHLLKDSATTLELCHARGRQIAEVKPTVEDIEAALK